MKTKLLKKLRRQFSKRYTVAAALWKDGVSFRIYDEGLYLYTSWNREDLHLRLRELYFRFIEEYVAEQKQLISESNKGKRMGKENQRAKEVRQYDKYGKFLKLWECISDASRELGISVSSICNCMKGLSKTSGGFIWRN